MRNSDFGAGETGIGQQRRLGTPLPCPPPILLAPVSEAAVWVTSSHKHALFLRKWKVSEVWWGAGCLQKQRSGLPLSYSPSRRDPTGALGTPPFSAFTTLASNPGKSWKAGRGCLFRCRGLCRTRSKGTWQEGARATLPCLCVSTSLLPRPGHLSFSPFFFFLPLAGKKS